jgi:hypothetical protein
MDKVVSLFKPFKTIFYFKIFDLAKVLFGANKFWMGLKVWIQIRLTRLTVWLDLNWHCTMWLHLSVAPLPYFNAMLRAARVCHSWIGVSFPPPAVVGRPPPPTPRCRGTLLSRWLLPEPLFHHFSPPREDHSPKHFPSTSPFLLAKPRHRRAVSADKIRATTAVLPPPWWALPMLVLLHLVAILSLPSAPSCYRTSPTPPSTDGAATKVRTSWFFHHLVVDRLIPWDSLDTTMPGTLPVSPSSIPYLRVEWKNGSKTDLQSQHRCYSVLDLQ